jgi:hypothetical protein
MSMEVYVFLKKSDLPVVSIWQRSIGDSGLLVDLDLIFDPTKDSGFVPCKLRGSGTGFEYFLSPIDDIASSYPDLKEVVQPYDSAATFSWGSRLDECAVALVAAATLAASSSGVMYDPQEGLEYQGADALRHAQEVYKQVLAII